MIISPAVCPSKMYRLVKHKSTFSRSFIEILRNLKFSLLCLLRLKLLTSFLTMNGSQQKNFSTIHSFLPLRDSIILCISYYQYCSVHFVTKEIDAFGEKYSLSITEKVRFTGSNLRKVLFSSIVSFCDNNLFDYKYFANNDFCCSSVPKSKKECIVEKFFC